MPFSAPNVKDEAEQSKYYLGFPKGLNLIQEKTLVNDKNITLGLNVMLVVDGITRRYGSDKVFDEASATKVFGQTVYYNKSAGTKYWLRIANARLQYLNGSNWTNVSSDVFTNVKTRFVQAANKIFIHNGTDAMRYMDSALSITTYTALASLTGLAVTPTGGTGSTQYSYRIAPFNDVGEGAACARVSISNGVATLSSTTYNAVTWNAVAGATGYNIYGRHNSGFEEVYLATVYTNAYNDTGDDVETTSKIPPEDNTTGGIKAKAGIFTLGRQFVFGVTEGSTYYPTRLYYSGTVNNIDTFNSSELGGGWVEIYANDGGEIVDIKPYDNGVLVFKNNGIFKFYFTTTGLPALQEVTRSHGGVSFEGSQFIDNDYMYVAQKENRIFIATVGFQANYAVDQLRTNEVSIFITDGLTDVNRAYLSNICTFYYENKFAFAYTRGANTENDVGYVVDTRFGGWAKWDGLPMEVTSYQVYDNGTTAKLYGGSANDGYMIELFKTARNDDGEAFTTKLGTKFFNNGMFDVDKIFRNPTLWFKYIEGGSITAEVYVDGTRLAGTADLASSGGGAGAGMDLAGSILPGGNYSTPVIVNQSADVPRELTMFQIARSMGIYLIDDSLNTNWLFMGLHINMTPLVGKPMQQTEKVQLSTS